MASHPRGSHNPNVDDLSYNPQADAGIDSAAFEERTDAETQTQPVGARGASNQPTSRDFDKEDAQTARSDDTGRIPRGEVQDVLSSATAEEKEKAASGYTRGRRVDAYRQERDVDRALDEAGI